MTAGLRVARAVAWSVLPAELVLVVCVVAGVRIPAAVVLGAEALVLAVLVLDARVLWRMYASRRRDGTVRREALRSAVGALVPVALRRLVVHEFRALHSLGLWVVRRRHRVPEGALPVPYTEPQTGVMYTFAFVSVLETVVLALVIPWPLVHAILLVVDVYGVVVVFAIHASCVTRPHLVGADGSLRLRYGALFDLRVPASVIASARVDRRFPGGGPVRVDEGGTLDLAVWCGQSMRRAWAERRSRATAPSGAIGRVRRMPVPVSAMSRAAAIPVSRETWAFQPSAGSGAR
ncbi:hypothetical protein [Streptomyces sp. SM11]|uniref:hypothetical protein n=1 Tax=Streptomyces sp. SM11 TaxID=565557 RepID=UPI00215602D4|nr:hypothetical protein [Streptomyces sp. SM11]